MSTPREDHELHKAGDGSSHLNALKDDDEDLMIAIQESMFVFDNLVMSDDKRCRRCCSVDTEDLVLH